MASDEDDLNWVLSNPSDMDDIMTKVDCEDSLMEFTRNAWHALEPETPMIDGWVLDAMADHLEAVTAGDLKKLVINVPPGFMKSLLVSVFWPAWEWGPKNMAHLRYLCGSFSMPLATQNNTKTRDLIQSEWYQANWGDRYELRKDQRGKLTFGTTKMGIRLTFSTGSPTTGKRGDRVILDDPNDVKTSESEAVREGVVRFLTETLPTRVNSLKDSAIVIIQQRTHVRDATGILTSNELGFTNLMIPMEYDSRRTCYTKIKPTAVARPELETKRKVIDIVTSTIEWVDAEPDEPGAEQVYCQDPRYTDGQLAWVERFGEREVEDLKKTLSSEGGDYAIAGQLQQRPVPRGGGLFKEEWLNVIDIHEQRGGWVCRGWDLASSTKKKAAWTAGIKLRMMPNGRLIVEDVIHFRGGPEDVYDRVVAAAHRDGKQCRVSLPLDPGQASRAQKLEFARRLQGFNFHITPESGSKADRAVPVASQAKVGNLFMVKAPWNEKFKAELTMFPGGTYKDMGDALSRAYHECNTMRQSVSLPGASRTVKQYG